MAMGRQMDGSSEPRPRFRTRSFLALLVAGLVVAGGVGYGSFALVREFGHRTGAWKEVKLTGALPLANSDSVAYAPGARKVLVYYGTDSGVPSQTWGLDLARNTVDDLKAPAVEPGIPFVQASAYDESSGRMIRLSLTEPTDDSQTLAVQTWAYDPTTNTWTDLHAAASPPALISPSMAYDPGLRKIVLFGGSGSHAGVVFQNGTWAYDSAANTWTELKPAHAPTGRSEAAMAYDQHSKRLILFGGMQYSDDRTKDWKLLGDTWAYDAKTNDWTNVRPVGAPSPRSGSAMAYDEALGKVILFGGVVTSGGVSNDTWAFDPGSEYWAKLKPAGPPPRRTGALLFYDRESHRTILFGGSDAEKIYSDIWAFAL
jgi:N-acetylneuraminic acid mutarotase